MNIKVNNVELRLLFILLKRTTIIHRIKDIQVRKVRILDSMLNNDVNKIKKNKCKVEVNMLPAKLF